MTKPTPTRDYEDFGWRCSCPYMSKGEWLYNNSQRHSIYRHPQAVVEIDECRHAKPVTALRLTYQGYMHQRRWEHAFGDKTLARLAREMVEEIVEW